MVFVILQIIALNAYVNLKYLIQNLLTAAWAFSSYFMKIKNNFSSYLYLKENNKSIQKENIELRKKKNQVLYNWIKKLEKLMTLFFSKI